MIFDAEQISELIPQRYPILLVDRIIELEQAKRVVGIKNIAINEQFFKGHFPEKPIMPASLIIEAMAQVSTFLFFKKVKKSKKLNFYLAIVKDARFFKPVLPGDQLRIEAKGIRIAEDTGAAKIVVTSCDQTICEAELVFARRKDA